MSSTSTSLAQPRLLFQKKKKTPRPPPPPPLSTSPPEEEVFDPLSPSGSVRGGAGIGSGASSVKSGAGGDRQPPPLPPPSPPPPLLPPLPQQQQLPAGVRAWRQERAQLAQLVLVRGVRSTYDVRSLAWGCVLGRGKWWQRWRTRERAAWGWRVHRSLLRGPAPGGMPLARAVGGGPALGRCTTGWRLHACCPGLGRPTCLCCLAAHAMCTEPRGPGAASAGHRHRHRHRHSSKQPTHTHLAG